MVLPPQGLSVFWEGPHGVARSAGPPTGPPGTGHAARFRAG